MPSMLDAARARFPDATSDPVAIWSPGRVNLIGDHIDYSGGSVLPMAIDRGTRAIAFPRSDRTVQGWSANLRDDGVIAASLDDLGHDPSRGWFNYVLGVLWAMDEAGHTLENGFDLFVDGDIPDGAGLSSSASIELVAGVTANAIGLLGVDPTELAVLGQRAENDYVGVACGIMDQLAIARGVAEHALLMDCSTLTVEPVPLSAAEATVVVTNTNQRRTLAGSEYNDRRRAVERAVGIVDARRETPLSRPVDATADDLAAAEDELNAEGVLPYIRHTITEQARVLTAAKALRAHDIGRFGELMRESHESLDRDFRVTSPQLDVLAEAAWSTPGVFGARMTGAGFGGCTVNLIEPDAVADAVPRILAEYRRRTGIQATAFEVAAGDGARVVPEGFGA